ncbi:MAG: P-loop NTPase [Desulfotomaculales bacterium]
MAHPGWLANKTLSIYIPGRGAFASRILGLQKGLLVIMAPAAGTQLAWLTPGTEIEFTLPGQENTLPLRGKIVERRLKPVPVLFVSPTDDIPFAQAISLRPNKIITVASGKGGTGKTFVSVNLAFALGQLNLRVGILDADLGTANVATVLGLRPTADLSVVLTGEKRLAEVGIKAWNGLVIYPGIAGGYVPDISPWQFARLLAGIGEIEECLDHLFIDSGAGLSPRTTNFLLAADFVILVTNDTPTSILDAYGLLKSLAVKFWVPEVGLVMNRVTDTARAQETALRFIETARRYLNVKVLALGLVREDGAEHESSRCGRPLLVSAPDSPAARDLQAAASRLRDRLVKTAAPGRLQVR